MVLCAALAWVLLVPYAGAHHDSSRDISHQLLQTAIKQLDHFQYIANNFESWSPRKKIENINDFVDFVISEVRNNFIAFNLDPLDLPEVNEYIELMGNDVHVNLSNGTFRDSSSIFRNGDVSLSYKNRVLRTRVPIFFKSLKLNYVYDFLVSNEDGNKTQLAGILKGEVIVVDVNFRIALNFKELEIKLEELRIENIGSIKMKFDGNMLSWILQSLTEYLTDVFKNEVTTLVQYVSKFAVKRVLDTVNNILSGVKP